MSSTGPSTRSQTRSRTSQSAPVAPSANSRLNDVDSNAALLSSAIGSATPSPEQEITSRREGDDFRPRGPNQPKTPAVARNIGAADGRKLNDAQKLKVIEIMLELKLPTDRCLITNELIINFCHLVRRTLGLDDLRLLKEHWGVDRFDVNGPINIILEDPTFHHMLDHAKAVPIPEPAQIAKIKIFYEELSTGSETVKVPNVFSHFRRPAGGWRCKLLALDIDPERRIFRHELQKSKEKEGVYESTGRYIAHSFPYPDLSFVTHAHVIPMVWHAGAELKNLSLEKRAEIWDRLEAEGANDMLQAIEDIEELYRIWGQPRQTTQGPALPLRTGDPDGMAEFQNLSESEGDDVFGGSTQHDTNSAPSFKLRDSDRSTPPPNSFLDPKRTEDGKRLRPSPDTDSGDGAGRPASPPTPSKPGSRKRAGVTTGDGAIVAVDRGKRSHTQSERGTKPTGQASQGRIIVADPLRPLKGLPQRTQPDFGAGSSRKSGASSSSSKLGNRGAQTISSTSTDGIAATVFKVPEVPVHDSASSVLREPIASGSGSGHSRIRAPSRASAGSSVSARSHRAAPGHQSSQGDGTQSSGEPGPSTVVQRNQAASARRSSNPVTVGQTASRDRGSTRRKTAKSRVLTFDSDDSSTNGQAATNRGTKKRGI